LFIRDSSTLTRDITTGVPGKMSFWGQITAYSIEMVQEFSIIIAKNDMPGQIFSQSLMFWYFLAIGDVSFHVPNVAEVSLRHSGDRGRHSGDRGRHSGDRGRHSGDRGRHSGDRGRHWIRAPFIEVFPPGDIMDTEGDTKGDTRGD
jgi:hypothetical protein